MAGNRKGAKKTGGSWKPGQSGNPRGRLPDKDLQAARKAAQELILPYAADIVERLVDIATTSTSENAAISACRELLNRLWGKPPESVNLSSNPIEVKHTVGLTDEQIDEIKRRILGIGE